MENELPSLEELESECESMGGDCYFCRLNAVCPKSDFMEEKESE